MDAEIKGCISGFELLSTYCAEDLHFGHNISNNDELFVWFYVVRRLVVSQGL